MTQLLQFRGFPKGGLQFLQDLEQNNNRDWFEAHKKEYQTLLLEPAQAFVTEMGSKLQSITPIEYDSRTDGKGTLMRIHRDTRFSKDKSPYKTSLAGKFPGSCFQKNEGPAFGFHFQATGMGLMAGMFQFPNEILTAYRDAVADETCGDQLADALASVLQGDEYHISGQHYKRVPNGYDANHKHAELLKYNGLYVHTADLGADVLTSPDLVNVCFEHFKKMSPVYLWLAQFLQRS